MKERTIAEPYNTTGQQQSCNPDWQAALLIGDHHGKPNLLDDERSESPGWGWCRTCGVGYPDTPQAKGQCHDCRRLRAFVQPLLQSLRDLMVLIDKDLKDRWIGPGRK